MPLTTPSVGHQDLATAAQATVNWFRLQAIRVHTNEIRAVADYMKQAKQFLSPKCDDPAEAFPKMVNAESDAQSAKPVLRRANRMLVMAFAICLRLVNPKATDVLSQFLAPERKNGASTKEEKAIRLLLASNGFVGLARLSVAGVALENLVSIELSHALEQAWKAVGEELKEVFAQLARHLHLSSECRRCTPYEIPGSVQESWANLSPMQIAEWFAAD